MHTNTGARWAKESGQKPTNPNGKRPFLLTQQKAGAPWRQMKARTTPPQPMAAECVWAKIMCRREVGRPSLAEMSRKWCAWPMLLCGLCFTAQTATFCHWPREDLPPPTSRLSFAFAWLALAHHQLAAWAIAAAKNSRKEMRKAAAVDEPQAQASAKMCLAALF